MTWWGVWLGVIGLGLNRRDKGEVGAGIGTDGRLRLVPALVVFVFVFVLITVLLVLLCVLSMASFDCVAAASGALVSVPCLDWLCLRCCLFLFFPPIPADADTSANTLNGSPFSSLPCFEPPEPLSLSSLRSLSLLVVSSHMWRSLLMFSQWTRLSGVTRFADADAAVDNAALGVVSSESAEADTDT